MNRIIWFASICIAIAFLSGCTTIASDVEIDTEIEGCEEITADVVYVDDEPGIPKTSRDLVLMGGPCINTLVADLATSGKFPYTCANWPGRDFGRVELIEDAFASGYTALVIAGTHAEQTDLAARIVQQGFTGASATKLAGSSVEVTGTVSSPAYS